MADIKRKSMQDLAVSIGGLAIDQGGGESDFVSVTSPQRFDSKTGVHGDVVFFDIPGTIYEVSITTLETSPINESLQGLFGDSLRSTSSGPYTMTIADRATGERLSGQALIVQEPDRTKKAEAGSYEWKLHIASPDGWQYQTATPIV